MQSGLRFRTLAAQITVLVLAALAVFSLALGMTVFQITREWLEGTAVAGLEALASVMDITERKRAEQALRESEEQFRVLFTSAHNLITIVDKSGKTLLANPAWQKTLGYTPETQGDLMEHIRLDDRARVVEAWQAMQRGESDFTDVEYGYRTASGEYVFLETTIRDLAGIGKPLLSVIAHDITKRKRMEEQIKASLREKKVMLAEIHHRVKNNLQIVSSLLNFQTDYAQDEQAIEALRDSQHRVYSMALIHEQLYRVPDLAQIDFANYVQNLAANLFAAYRVNLAYPVTLKLDVHDVFLEIKQAIPCGLIINELVSNALKHAFPADLPPVGAKEPALSLPKKTGSTQICGVGSKRTTVRV